MKDVQHYEIGKAIRKMRLLKGLTQEQLGQKAHMQRFQISKYETTKAYPYIPTILTICKALEISPALLFKEASEITRKQNLPRI